MKMIRRLYPSYTADVQCGGFSSERVCSFTRTIRSSSRSWNYVCFDDEPETDFSIKPQGSLWIHKVAALLGVVESRVRAYERKLHPRRERGMPFVTQQELHLFQRDVKPKIREYEFEITGYMYVKAETLAQAKALAHQASFKARYRSTNNMPMYLNATPKR